MLKFAMLLCFALGLPAADFPQSGISNGLIQARFYLPDAARGYYQGTRFDWSGNTYSLRYKGHEYFGQWFERYDPKIHDAIMGPVEEFRTNDAGLGYDEAKVGGKFIRIGVGVVRKPEEKQYRTFNAYEILDPGRWTVRTGKDWIEFVHQLKDDSGYAYVYRKKVSLVKNQPRMVIAHSLKNTGRRPIEATQYNHNFFVIDARPTGPGAVVKFAFEPKAKGDVKGLAKIGGGQLVYLKELEKGQSVFTEIVGYGTTAKDYDFRVENSKARAGVRITGDRPIHKLVFWSIRTTLCPEPYVKLQIAPGREQKWKINYDFYELP